MNSKESKKAGKSSIVLCLRALFGDLNRGEKYYVYVYVLSVVLGLSYGFFDKSIARGAVRHLPLLESQLSVTSALEIFLHNFEVALFSAVTGGVGGLVSNFLTYSAISGFFGLPTNQSPTLSSSISPLLALVIVLLALIGFIVVALLEWGGSLCFAITGFTVLERAEKRKTKLRRGRLLLLGMALLFVAALLDWSLAVLMYATFG
jgi:hypothetical protein